MNHRTGRIVFAVLTGILVATFSYRWITNPAGREARALEVGVVVAAEAHLRLALQNDAIEIVDPLMPKRKVGKVYVYPEDRGWSVSGYYRRDESDRWHPYLMTLSTNLELTSLKAKDTNPELVSRAEQDPLIELTH